MTTQENIEFEKSLKVSFSKYPDLILNRNVEIYKEGFISGLNVYKPISTKCNCLYCGMECNNELDLSHHVQICEKIEEE